MDDDVLADGSVGSFLTSINNYERIHNAEHSVLPAQLPSGASKNQQKKAAKQHNDQVRTAVGGEIADMFASGTISAGDVRSTYQSSFDHDGDFGAELGLNGVWGDQYVVHGHYGSDGTAHPGSVGIKNASDTMGMRIAHGIPEGLGGSASDLRDADTLSALSSLFGHLAE